MLCGVCVCVFQFFLKRLCYFTTINNNNNNNNSYEVLAERFQAFIAQIEPELPPLSAAQGFIVESPAPSTSTRKSDRAVNAAADAADAADAAAAQSSSSNANALERARRYVAQFVRFLKTDVNWIHTPLLLGTPLIALYERNYMTTTTNDE